MNVLSYFTSGIGLFIVAFLIGAYVGTKYPSTNLISKIAG